MELFGDREALYAMPEVFPAALFDYPGVKQLFYSGPAWRGRPTRVFACCGVPEGASPENPVPGVVLIHGGGATALADWVALWNRRGYAAAQMASTALPHTKNCRSEYRSGNSVFCF